MAVPTTQSSLQRTERSNLCIVSYNMHGFNQGTPTVTELIADKSADIIMLQEHWLTPANLNLIHYVEPIISCMVVLL